MVDLKENLYFIAQRQELCYNVKEGVIYFIVTIFHPSCYINDNK